MVHKNKNTYGARPGDVQPETCVRCKVKDRMFLTRLDGLRYWQCDCGELYESEETQGKGGV